MRVAKRHEKLNIGAGTSPDPTMLNSDIYPGSGIDLVFDVEKEWPIEDESLLYISCSHVLEHLRDHIGFFSRAHKGLKMGGRMNIRVPYGWNQAAWWDPTHIRPWTHEGFCFVQPGYSNCTRNLVQKEFDFAFWIISTTVICGRTWARLHSFNFRPWHRLLHKVGRFLINVYTEVFVDLEKTTLDDPRSTTFGGDMKPNIAPTRVAAYAHQLRGLPEVQTGEYCEIIVIP